MQKISPNRSVVLLWGGTWGHIFPLVSLQKALSSEGFWPFYWIGESGSLEEKVAGDEGIGFHAIRSGKLRRYFSWRTFVEPFNILIGTVQSFLILRKLRPSFVFCKGGYVSLPAAVAAKLLSIPTYLHESDAIPGLANRWVGKFSDAVFLGFSEAEPYFSWRPCVRTGQLLNPEIPWWTAGSLEGADRKPSVLAVGGSLGSTRVFDAVYRCAQSLPDVDFEIVLGKLNRGLREKFSELQNVVCYDFLSQTEMAEAYARSDVVVTRAGATSLAEIEASWSRMVIVPLEGSANGHQWANASAYAEKWYSVLPESDLWGLADTIRSLLSDRNVRIKNPAPSGEGIRAVVAQLLSRSVAE